MESTSNNLGATGPENRRVQKMSVRRIPKSFRNVTGRVARVERPVPASFESTLERDLFIILDFSPHVLSFEEQPIRIEWDECGEKRLYTPDVLVYFKGCQSFLGRTGAQYPWLVEVKYSEELRRDARALISKFRAAVNEAFARNWRFKVLTERDIRTPFLWNARFLRSYRHSKPDNDICEKIRSVIARSRCVTPEELVSSFHGGKELRLKVTQSLWYLVATGVLDTDMNARLSMQSAISLRSESQ